MENKPTVIHLDVWKDHKPKTQYYVMRRVYGPYAINAPGCRGVHEIAEILYSVGEVRRWLTLFGKVPGVWVENEYGTVWAYNRATQSVMSSKQFAKKLKEHRDAKVLRNAP